MSNWRQNKGRAGHIDSPSGGSVSLTKGGCRFGAIIHSHAASLMFAHFWFEISDWRHRPWPPVDLGKCSFCLSFLIVSSRVACHPECERAWFEWVTIQAHCPPPKKEPCTVEEIVARWMFFNQPIDSQGDADNLPQRLRQLTFHSLLTCKSREMVEIMLKSTVELQESMMKVSERERWWRLHPFKVGLVNKAMHMRELVQLRQHWHIPGRLCAQECLRMARAAARI